MRGGTRSEGVRVTRESVVAPVPAPYDSLMSLERIRRSSSNELNNLRRFIARVQSMLDHDEEERLDHRKGLTGQAAIVSDTFADYSPQAFYTSVILSLVSILDRHTHAIAHELKLPTLSEEQRKQKGFLEQFRLRAALVAFPLTEAQWTEMAGLAQLRNSFAHGKANRSARDFTARRGILRYSASDDGLCLVMDDPNGDLIWLYHKDVSGLVTEVEEFFDGVYEAVRAMP